MMSIRSILIALTLTVNSYAKSWIDLVGMGGSARIASTPPIRHVCPPGSGFTCRGLPTRPCPSGTVSNPQASIFLNEALYLHWNRNSLSQGETDNTCIKIGIAPFQADPSFAAFTMLEDCLPFSHGSSGIDTDAYVMIPAVIGSGAYTVLWQWTQWGDTYTSCADITINSIPVPRPDVNPMPLADTQSCTSGTPDSDSYCRARFGFQSYCRSWKKDKCDRSFCYGQSEVSDDDCSTFVIGGRQLDMTNFYNQDEEEEEEFEYINSELSDSPYLYDRVYEANGCLGLPSEFCQEWMDQFDSYCQPKVVDNCGRAMCHGDMQMCETAVELNSFELE